MSKGEGMHSKTVSAFAELRNLVNGGYPGAEFTVRGSHLFLLKRGFETSSTTVGKMLGRMIEDGLLRKERSGHYTIPVPVVPPAPAPEHAVVPDVDNVPIPRVRACELLNEYPGSSMKWLENKYDIHGFYVGVGVYFESADINRLLGEKPEPSVDFTYAQIEAGLRRHNKDHGIDSTLAILRRHGCERISEVFNLTSFARVKFARDLGL